MVVTGVRERQKRDRRQRIFAAAMALFEERGFQETTVVAIARAAGVSRGTVFNYYPYKEAILIDHFARGLEGLRERTLARCDVTTPIDALYRVFDELGVFVEANHRFILPLSYELLNPEQARSRRAFEALPLVAIVRELLGDARELGRVRDDFSPERLARTVANTYFLTALQWAVYRHDRSLRDELRKALKLTLEGIVV